MKRFAALALVIFLSFVFAGACQVVEFKLSGLWRFGVGAKDLNMTKNVRTPQGRKVATPNEAFVAGERLWTYLDAIASENLRGFLGFEMGSNEIRWGKAGDGPTGGGALGADGKIVRVLSAYIEWMPPFMDLKVQMDLIPISLPDAAGGAVILQTTAPGITASYSFNENVALTGMWFRMMNDNYKGTESDAYRNANYLDNFDLFGFSLPVKFDGFNLTPWFLAGMIGKNATDGLNYFNTTSGYNLGAGNVGYSWYPYPGIDDRLGITKTSKPYGGLFWMGVPIKLSRWDPWNFEFDFNYSYIESMGKYNAIKFDVPNHDRRIEKRSVYYRHLVLGIVCLLHFRHRASIDLRFCGKVTLFSPGFSSRFWLYPIILQSAA